MSSLLKGTSTPHHGVDAMGTPSVSSVVNAKQLAKDFWEQSTQCFIVRMLALFNDEGHFVSAPHGSGPVSTEAAHRLRSRGSQMEQLEESETGPALSLAFSTDSEGLVQDLEARSAISFTPDMDLLSGES